MNIYQLEISGPEAQILQELLGDKITALEWDIAEDPGTDFNEPASTEADLIHCRNLKEKLESLNRIRPVRTKQ